MKYKKALKYFMIKKTQLLTEKLGIPRKLYLLSSDLKSINNWKEFDCRLVYFRLVHNIKHEQDLQLLSIEACIFCLYHLRFPGKCYKCGYGYNHKRCKELNSDYNLVVFIANYNIKSTTKNVSFFDIEKITKPFFIELIKKIEKKYGDKND